MLESPSHITTNLRRVYLSATPEQKAAGMVWYRAAFGIAQDLGHQFGKLTWEICGIIAALSPQCSWERNLVRVREYLETGHSPGLPPAWNGEKVRHFRASIFLEGRSGHVCVDRHMIAAALPLTASVDKKILKKVFDSPPRIKRIQKAVRLIAKEYGIWPAQAQAIIWVVQRGTGESPATDHHPVQQVRRPVRVGRGPNSARSKGRGAQGRVVKQRVDGRPLPRPRRTQHAKPQGSKNQKGTPKGVRL